MDRLGLVQAGTLAASSGQMWGGELPLTAGHTLLPSWREAQALGPEELPPPGWRAATQLSHTFHVSSVLGLWAGWALYLQCLMSKTLQPSRKLPFPSQQALLWVTHPKLSLHPRGKDACVGARSADCPHLKYQIMALIKLKFMEKHPLPCLTYCFFPFHLK